MKNRFYFLLYNVYRDYIEHFTVKEKNQSMYFQISA